MTCNVHGGLPVANCGNTEIACPNRLSWLRLSKPASILKFDADVVTISPDHLAKPARPLLARIFEFEGVL